jgi:hypothetical protein
MARFNLRVQRNTSVLKEVKNSSCRSTLLPGRCQINLYAAVKFHETKTYAVQRLSSGKEKKPPIDFDFVPLSLRDANALMCAAATWFQYVLNAFMSACHLVSIIYMDG